MTMVRVSILQISNDVIHFSLASPNEDDDDDDEREDQNILPSH